MYKDSQNINPEETSPEVQNRVSLAPTMNMYPPKMILKKV